VGERHFNNLYPEPGKRHYKIMRKCKTCNQRYEV